MPIKQIKQEVANQNMMSASAPRRSTFTNVAKLLADDEDHQHDWYHMNDERRKRRKAMKFVRVKDQVANVCNGHVLLRRSVNAPDGLYNIDAQGWLESIKDSQYIDGYPDVDMLVRYNICAGWYEFNRKDLEMNRLLKSVIPNEIIAKMIGAVSYIKRLSKHFDENLCVCIDHNSMYGSLTLDDLWRADERKEAQIRAECQKGTFYHPFGLKYPVYLNSSYLEIGLIEMSRYPVIGLIRDEAVVNDDDHNDKPLVFECDRGNMFAVAPIKR